MRTLSLVVLFALSVVTTASDPAKDGWTELLVKSDNKIWKKVADGKKLKPEGEGTAWMNGEKGRIADLITQKSYKDVEVHVEFLLGKNSNSGIKFHALYEIQLRDTAANKGELTGDDCGGIYPRAEEKPKYHHIDKGIAPKVNAAKPAGEWQTLIVTFHSPRFNEKGEKTTNAKIVKATLNGQVIHENVEMKTPTGGNYVKKELAEGPFMLQADHGPVAFRNVRIREVK
jgi:hypothetical protein